MPTALENQAARRSEELIREDGRLSPTLNFHCDLFRETGARKQLRQTNFNEVKLHILSQFLSLFLLEMVSEASHTAASGLFIGIGCLISLTLVATLIPQGNWRQLEAAVKFCQHSSKQSRIC